MFVSLAQHCLHRRIDLACTACIEMVVREAHAAGVQDKGYKDTSLSVANLV